MRGGGDKWCFWCFDWEDLRSLPFILLYMVGIGLEAFLRSQWAYGNWYL